MRQYFVYILTNKANKVLYVGITNNLERRISEHKNKIIKGFSSKYNLTKLVFIEEFGHSMEAIEFEKKIKGWLRIKKIKLIESRNPEWKDLAEDI